MRNKTQKKKDVQLKQNNRNYEITWNYNASFWCLFFCEPGQLQYGNSRELGQIMDSISYLAWELFCLFWLSYSWVVIMF